MSLVLQLQELALAADADLPNLLHRALIVATKLNLERFGAWVRLELDGYPNGIDLPAYRLLKGQLSYHNPFHGTQRASLDDPEMQERLTQAPMRDSVARIVHLLSNNNPSKGAVRCTFPPAMQQVLQGVFQEPLEFYLVVGSHQLKGVLDSVKTELLDWTLRLERDGIVGEGMRFTESEREKAAKGEDKLTPTIILNFIGRMEKSQLQQFSPGASQTT